MFTPFLPSAVLLILAFIFLLCSILLRVRAIWTAVITAIALGFLISAVIFLFRAILH